KPGNVADEPRGVGRTPRQIMRRGGPESPGLERFGLRHDPFTSRPQCATIWWQGRLIESTEAGYDRTSQGSPDETDHRARPPRSEPPDESADDQGAGSSSGPHIH